VFLLSVGLLEETYMNSFEYINSTWFVIALYV
jgi:hypothetical protein